MGAQLSAKGKNASRQCVKFVGDGAGKVKAALRRRQADPRAAATEEAVRGSEEGSLDELQLGAVWDVYAPAPGCEVLEWGVALVMAEHAVAAMTQWVLDHALDHCEPHELPKGFKERYKGKDAEKIGAALLEGLEHEESADGAARLLSRDAFLALAGRPFEELLTEHDVFLSPEEEGHDVAPVAAAAVAPRAGSRSGSRSASRSGSGDVWPDDDGDAGSPAASPAAAASEANHWGGNSFDDDYQLVDEPGAPLAAAAAAAAPKRGKGSSERRLAAQMHDQFVNSMGDDDLIL